MPSPVNEDALKRATGQFDESYRQHTTFCAGVERRYRAYRGWVDQLDESKAHHPPFVMRAVESTLASLIDDDLRFTVRQRMMLLDPDAQARAEQGVKAMQSLSDWQVRQSGLADEQRAFNLQHAIAGITVAKTFWTEETEMRRHMRRTDTPVQDPLTGQPLLGLDGSPVTRPTYQEETKQTVVYDGPTTQTVDIRDFGWHQAATELKTSRYVWHRVAMDKEEIERAIDKGRFGPDAGGWSKTDILDALKPNGTGDQLDGREQSASGTSRWKDKIEVVEMYDRVLMDVTTFGNRTTLLRYKPKFPFWHNDVPFVVCSAQPDLFRIPGISQVEKIEQLQTMLWKLSTQRLLNLELVNNAIFIFSQGEDPDDFPFGPGEQWFMEDPEHGFNQWAPNPIPAEISVGAEQALKGDMQDLSGGYPFASGATSETVDNKTATGASIISGLAQRSIDMAKGQVYRAWRDIARQRGVLTQQFVQAPTLIPVVGEDGQQSQPMLILPELLAHDFMWEVEPEPNQMRKQEEQAALQAAIQVGAGLMGPLSILAQSGMGKLPKLDLLFEKLLEKAGLDNPQQYFTSAPPPPQLAAVGQPGSAPANGNGGTPTGPNLGITAPQAADASSPSNATSLSGEANLARLLAASGPTQ